MPTANASPSDSERPRRAALVPGVIGLAWCLGLPISVTSADPGLAQTPTAPTRELPPRERARPADERALFALLAASPGVEARYEEEKHLALLAVPIKSRGTLYFLPPGHLARVVDEPERSRLLITPDEIRTVARGKEKRIDLGRSSDVRAFVTSLGDVLAGRREGLARMWSIAYAPIPDQARGWTLALVPRADANGGEALARLVKSLTLTGEGEAVVSIDVVEASGDRTITRVVESDSRRVFSDAERAEWFGLPPLAKRASAPTDAPR